MLNFHIKNLRLKKVQRLQNISTQKKCPTIVSWSSGKDSALTLNRLLHSQTHEVVALFTTYYEDYIPFQTTPLSVLQAQAEAIGLPLISLQLPEIFPDNKLYKALVVNALNESDIAFQAVAFGDMFCNGIAEYRQSYIELAGWQCVFPLMDNKPKKLAYEIIDCGIKAFVCCVDTQQFDGRYVAQEYTKNFVDGLMKGIDPCGENGEFHTLVYDAPFFRFPIPLIKQSINRQGRFHYQNLKLFTEDK